MTINANMGDGPRQIDMFRAARLMAKRYRGDAEKIGEYASDLETRTERLLLATESELRLYEQREDRDQILNYRKSSLELRASMRDARTTALGLSTTLDDMWEFSQELTASKTELSASMARIGKVYESVIAFADGIEARTARWLEPSKP